MYSLVAFVNAIIIASSVFGSAYSFPTLEPGDGLDSILPVAQPTWFEAYPNTNNREVKTLKGYAVDSEGRSCFQYLRDPNFRRLFNKTTFETHYANETAEFCPPWAQFKQCLSEHVNSDKCSADEKQVVLETPHFNVFVAVAERFCNPSSAPQFRNLLKNLLNEDLLDCLFGHTYNKLRSDCVEKTYDEDVNNGWFRNLGEYFDCMKPGVRQCANGDHVKDEISVRLWVELGRAIQDGHRDFWN